MREAILVFGGDGEAAVRLRRALLPLKVMVRPIPLADYGHSLGRLAGDGSCPAAEGPFEGEELPQTLLVLAVSMLLPLLVALLVCIAGPAYGWYFRYLFAISLCLPCVILTGLYISSGQKTDGQI